MFESGCHHPWATFKLGRRAVDNNDLQSPRRIVMNLGSSDAFQTEFF